MLVMALLSGAVLVVLGFAGAYQFLEPELPEPASLRDVRSQLPLSVYSADGKLIAQIGEQRRVPVAYEQIPRVVIDAFLAAEDDRFFEHPGVDWQGLVRAVASNVSAGGVREGGGTITMQLARNTILTSERTLHRKLKEVFTALRLERSFTKQEILTLYLNRIFLGQRAYGVGAAAEVYFDKKVGDLTLAEAALIAGLPRSPSRDNPVASVERATQRRAYVLRRMQETDKIDQAQHDAAAAEPISRRIHGPEHRTRRAVRGRDGACRNGAPARAGRADRRVPGHHDDRQPAAAGGEPRRLAHHPRIRPSARLSRARRASRRRDDRRRSGPRRRLQACPDPGRPRPGDRAVGRRARRRGARQRRHADGARLGRSRVGAAGAARRRARAVAQVGRRRAARRRRGVPRAGRTRSLSTRAGAGRRRRARGAESERRRDRLAGRRIRLRGQQVQPRGPGQAPAGFGVQAVSVLRGARKGLHAGDAGQRRPDRAAGRRRRGRRGGMAAAEHHQALLRADADARGPGAFPQSRVDPSAARHRHRLCVAAHRGVRLRAGRAAGQPDARARHGAGDAARHGARFCRLCERRIPRHALFHPPGASTPAAKPCSMPRRCSRARLARPVPVPAARRTRRL